MTEVVIIGAGISGASLSYMLKKRNISHLVMDKKGIALGASGSAGAFLLYKLFSNSSINHLSNLAYSYTIKLYKTLNINLNKKPSFFTNKISNDIYLNKQAKATNIYNQDGYLVDNGYFVNPLETINKLIDKDSFILENAHNITKKDNFYIINNKIKCKKIIIANGFDDSFSSDYLKIRKISGIRLSIQSKTINPYYIYSNVSISSSINKEIIIGSSNHRNNHEFQEKDINDLLKKANNILSIQNNKISYKHGIRACSIDYFPYVGELINEEKTIKENLNIRNGKKIKKFFYKEGIYTLKALASKGFSMSPYLANELISYIYDGKNISSDISLERRFSRYIRKN
jgi:glycine/D-amino acid oxidase-like deaminating enzyme